MSTSNERGRNARSPREIPAAGWRDIFWRVKDEMTTDHVSIVAAGVAFFSLLAIFPAMAALVSIAGLILDPATVQEQIASAASMLPAEARGIIETQAQAVASGESTGLGFAALFGLALTLYSASKGMKTLIEGMNIAYDEEEKRGMIALTLTALVLTLVMLLVMIAGLGVTLATPSLLGWIGLGSFGQTLVTYARWPLLGLFTVLALAVIYRYGPSRKTPKWRWVTPGAILATLLWIAASIAFSFYVRSFGSFNETYGTLGGIIILLTWLWLSAFIVLMGAELDSEMEHQTARDSTSGEAVPRGERGAVKADTVGERP